MTRGRGARALCHPVDVVDDLQGTLARIASIQIPRVVAPTGVALAVAYHSSCDYLPRNRRRVHYSPAGLAFAPRRYLYPPSLQPPPSFPICEERDLLHEAVAGGATTGVPVDAWVVYLHHDATTPAGDGEGRVVNAFGDLYPVALCPSAEVVGDYCEALTADVAARGPDMIMAEALHPQPFPHGYHHERTFGVGGLRRFLLSLCFCSACVYRAAGTGIDVGRLRARVRAVVDAAGPAGISARENLIADLAPAEISPYLRLRELATTELVRRCADVARAQDVEFTWMDATHAWADSPSGARDPAGPGWQIGCDLRAIAAVCRVTSACYGTAETWSGDLDESEALYSRKPDGVVVRTVRADGTVDPGWSGRVHDVVSRGIDWIGIYHYGLSPEPLEVRVEAPSTSTDSTGGGGAV